jgi:hypothetical protein
MSGERYWWGSTEVWDSKVMGLAILVATAVTSGSLFAFADAVQASGPAIEQGLSVESVSGLLWVSIGWIFVVGSITTGQTLTKEMGSESIQHVALRTLGNTLEYGLMTLLLIWMHGLYCNTAAATLFGSIYLIARIFYPVFYGYYGEFTVMVEFSTQPGYFAKGFLLTGLLYTLWTGGDLAAEFASVAYQPLILIGSWLVFALVFGMLVGVPLFLNFRAGADRKLRMDVSRQDDAAQDGQGLPQ